MDLRPSNPGSPPYTEPHDWITGYLTVHSMSKPSYRVAFALWIIIASFFLIGTLVRLTGTSTPHYFAHWYKWALRRRTWRKHSGKKEAERTGKAHQQPVPLPSNSNILSLVFLFILTMILCFVGPDYIGARRPANIPEGPPPPSTLQTRAVNMEEIERYIAYYTISKSWWTVAGRTGNIAFALFPLCILFSLKAAPFAIFALPYTTQFSFDKLSTAHRWVGRLIYFITVIHVLAWSIQLASTKNPVTGRTTYIYAWYYPPFVWGWAAFAPFTVLMASTFRFFRYNFYESFYALHVFLVPITLWTAGMHHPSVGWWCWSALVIWVAERAWRATWWFWVNGIFKRKMPNAPPREKSLRTHSRQSSLSSLGLKMGGAQLDSSSEYSHDMDYDAPLLRRHSRVPTRVETLMSPPETYVPPPGYALAELMPGKTIRLTVLTPECRPWAPGQHFLLSIPSINKFTSHPFTVGSICDQQSSNPAGRVLIFFIRAKAGWTKTLWDNVVALSVRDKYHCDGEEPPEGTYPPSRGVLFRTFVEGPFGSVARTDWVEYSSVLLVAGGSGVSFALSVLVYLCLCLSGRASKFLGGQSKPFSNVSRVRFVWLAREFSHISWCASIVRRCIALVSSSALQVDIFVTNVPKDSAPMPTAGADGSRPPRLSWMPGKEPIAWNTAGASSMEDVSLDSNSRVPIHLVAPSSSGHHRDNSMGDHNSLLMPNPHEMYGGRYADGGLRGQDHDYEMGLGGSGQDIAYDVLDDTHFNGDLDEDVIPAEESFNRRLRQEGALRRKMTKKMAMGGGLQDQDSLWVDLGQQIGSPTLILTPGPGEFPSPPHSSNGHEDPSKTSDSETLGKEPRRTTVPPYLQQRDPMDPRVKKLGRASMSSMNSMNSIRDKIMDVATVQAMLPKTGKGARGEEVALQFTDEEVEDMLYMTEFAWPGRPMLDKLLKEEIEKAKGAIVVACCGPTQLSASIRKIVAANIDPVKIKAGDKRGLITCVTEEFEY